MKMVNIDKSNYSYIMNELLLKYIKDLKINNVINPFINENCELTGIETYSQGKPIHRVDDVKIIYKNNKIIIKFKTKDLILAACIYLFIVNDPFGYVIDEPVYIDNCKIKRIKEDLGDFKEIIYNTNFRLPIHKIIVDLEKEWSNLFDYHKQCSIHFMKEKHNTLDPRILEINSSDNEEI